MAGTRGRRRGWGCLAVGVAALALGSSSAAATSRAVSARDRQATFAYLQAENRYEAAVDALARASVAPARAFAQRVEAECPDVLAGMPAETLVITKPDPRGEGEAALREYQRQAVELELHTGESAALQGALSGPERGFQAAVGPLRWSDAGVAEAVSSYLDSLLSPEPAAPAPAQACADLRTWAQSGFRRLSPRTKEISAAVLNRDASALGGPSVETLLRPLEGPAERALAERIARVGAARSDPAPGRWGRSSRSSGKRWASGCRSPSGNPSSRRSRRAARTRASTTGSTRRPRPAPAGLRPAGHDRVPAGARRAAGPGDRRHVLRRPRVTGHAVTHKRELECEDGSLTIAQALDRAHGPCASRSPTGTR